MSVPLRSHPRLRYRPRSTPPLPNLCRSPQHGILHITITPGQVAFCRGYHGCYPRYQCLSLVLICLEFIIHLIESACTRLLLTILEPLLCKYFEALCEINVRVEAIICEKLPPLMEITYHLRIIWRDRYGKLDI